MLIALAAAACVLLAALSLLIPSAPTTDSWGWIIWGREILHLELSTVVPGAPSWKPLPVLFTTPFALAGDAAPSLWLLVARAGALGALVVGYRLGDRLAGRWAGVLTVLGLVLSAHWLRELAHGYTEPLTLGLLFGAIHCHLSGRPKAALLLGAAVASTRPEAWFLLVLYGAVLWRRREVGPLLLAAVAVTVPALWLVPDWIGSGDPMHASRVSRMVVPTGTGATLTALWEAVQILPLPLSVTAVAGTVLARRRGDRAIPGIAALVGAWALLLTSMMLAGYPASSRFFVLPAGLLSVVGGAGAVYVAQAIRERRHPVAVIAVLALASAAPVAVRVEQIADQGRDALNRARLEADLRTTVDRSRVQLLRCGTPVIPNGLLWTKGLVAWELDLPLRRVRGIATSAFAFVERFGDPEGEPLPRLPPGRSVTVRPRIRPFVLLSPFAAAPIRVAGRPRLRLTTVAAAGRWRAMLPDPPPRLLRGGGRPCSVPRSGSRVAAGRPRS